MAIKLLLSLITTALLFVGCDSNDSTENFSTLTPEVKESLAFMGNEERLAFDIYNALYEARGSASTVELLNKIANKAEITHIQAVQDLIQKYDIQASELTNVENPVADMNTAVADMPAGSYDIAALQELYDALYEKGKESDRDALEVACMVEVTDIYDLEQRIITAEESEAPDVVDTFNFLLNGSYNHYWGFNGALIGIGVSDGCCSLGTIDGVNYCHEEYPRNH